MAANEYDTYQTSPVNGASRGGSARPPLSIDVSNANRGRIAPTQQKVQQMEARNTQADQGREYATGQNEAQVVMQDESPSSSGDEVAEGLRGRNEGEEQEDGEGGEMQDDGDDSGSFSDSLSSSPSIPDEDIDFSLVYALHTFLATVDGQASVVKGDKLLLLDDSNSYWWLVRVLKTQAVGYIPAENIETPFERLARLNKHRNVDLTSATQQDVDTGSTSVIAQTRFGGRIPPSQQPHPHQSQHPSARGVVASPSHKDHPRNISPIGEPRSQSSKGKTVLFTAPTYYEHSANGETDEEEYEDEDMEEGHEGELIGDQVFDDDDDGDESDFSDDNMVDGDEEEGIVSNGNAQVNVRQPNVYSVEQGPRGEMGRDEERGGGEEGDLSFEQRAQERAMHVQAQQAETGSTNWNQQPSFSPQERSQQLQQQQFQQQQHQEQEEQLAYQRSEERRYQQEQQELRQNQLRLQQQERATSASGQYSHPEPEVGVQRRGSDPSNSSRRNVSDPFDSNTPTKKLTATPEIVRDPTFDINDPFGDLPGGVPEGESSPVRVRGIEVVDPKNPRYNNLITERRIGDEGFGQHQRQPSGESGYGPENDNSINSVDTGASTLSGRDGDKATASKKLKKARESLDSEDGKAVEKKRKTGGILSGLFKKKDKKKKNESVDLRSSEEINRRDSPSGFSNGNESPVVDSRDSGVFDPSDSQTAETMFSTDAALRQQEVEAKQALYHQYGVHRAPGDLTNTMTPRTASLPYNNQQNLSPPPSGNFSSSTAQRMRPGSLIGSPNIPGLEVPLLSVLRVFAGASIDSEATFKTVLLNKSTTTSDLVKQAMQRFRLTGAEDRGEYYLTVKELGGDERPLANEQKPLVIFEALSDTASGPGFTIPSVKRSSIGSIESIESNLSLNPAITRLGMNDFSDDSAVKFYLNRRGVEDSSVRPASDTDSILTATGPNGHLNFDSLASGSSPSFRFAVRLLIFPEDLPENVTFDPQSNAIIPKSVLAERSNRNGPSSPLSPISAPREKIIFFPRNANVSEVIEAALDRFGIVDGVVDGGDEVEDRISRRRSVSRVKYGLAVIAPGRPETALHSSAKILDAYTSPPLLKPYDRSSKEFRRRSVDATLILGTTQDVQPTDPVFVIRRAIPRYSNGPKSPGPHPIAVDELAQQQQRRPSDTVHVPTSRESSLNATVSGRNPSAGNERSLELIARAASPLATRQDIIAAQREITRANQRAILSAQKNTDKGIDIVLDDRATIRSSRNFSDDRVRYSYIDEDGTEMDISEIIESEWGGSDAGTERRSTSRSSTIGGGSTDTESFRSAQQSPSPQQSPSAEDEEERAAIDALRHAPLSIDTPSTHPSTHTSTPLPPPMSSSSPLPTSSGKPDVLEAALSARVASSPLFNESLQDRLDRVLAKVQDGKGRNGSMGGRSRSSPSNVDNGRSSPAVVTGRPNPSGPGARSNLSQGTRHVQSSTDGTTPSLDQVLSFERSSPLAQLVSHAKQLSTSSGHSNGTDVPSPSTPVTSSSHPTTASTANTSADSRASNRGPAIVFRDDFGLETLMTIVDAESHQRTTRLSPDVAAETLFGHSLSDLNLHPDVQEWYAGPSSALEDIDTRLNTLLASLLQNV